jgi:transposase
VPMSGRRISEQRRIRRALHWHGIGLSEEEIAARLGVRLKTAKRLLAQAGVQKSNKPKEEENDERQDERGNTPRSFAKA